jgi:hypothetical protein
MDGYHGPKCVKNTPVELDKIADAVLNYRPKNKAKNLKPRKQRKAKRNVQDRESR